ncbi:MULTISPECIES: ParM/StbA family protein [unclassified Exiguobacterium]|uniref:ParM/StbA family protein n=1 Tax=unclassified Exiguobacterium TaxID=2644629 RepID=UPI001BEC5C5A|nr:MULTISPECIES: ParM/StbA family protein [unclassified Exiguobacterium]
MSKLSRGDFVVVDPGKHEVKGMVFTRTGTVKGVFSFPSKSKRVPSFNNHESSSPKQFKLVSNNRFHLVGEGVQAEYNADISKTNEHHKLCVYTSVAALVGNKEEPVNLVIGSPTNDFVASENIERYKELILGNEDGVISLGLNQEDKSFAINRLEVYPEGMAVLPRTLKQHTSQIHVVDIGGQNVNYRKYDEKGNTLQYFSLDYAGMNRLEQHLKSELRFVLTSQYFDIDSIDWNRAISERKIPQLDELLESGSTLSGFSDSEDFMQETVNTFIREQIIDALVRKSVYLNQRGHAILFTGGGSLRLESYLNEVLTSNAENFEISKTAKWDNCISYAIRYLTQVESDKSVVTKAVVKIIKAVKSVDFEENYNIMEEEDEELTIG